MGERPWPVSQACIIIVSSLLVIIRFVPDRWHERTFQTKQVLFPRDVCCLVRFANFEHLSGHAKSLSGTVSPHPPSVKWTVGAEWCTWGMFAGSQYPEAYHAPLAAPPAIANRCRVVENHLAGERSPRAPGGDRAARDRWELHLPTPLTSCCAVARPRAVRAREEGLQGAQYRRRGRELQCGCSIAEFRVQSLC